MITGITREYLEAEMEKIEPELRNKIKIELSAKITPEHKEAVERLRGIYLATDGEAARYLAEKLISDWHRAGYARAADCLGSALRKFLTFFEFPAEHARHLRTTNPIESVFASVRLRLNAARRFRTARSGLHLVFKLLERCQKGWQKIAHPEKLKEVKLPG